jgi:hypothetical protein
MRQKVRSALLNSSKHISINSLEVIHLGMAVAHYGLLEMFQSEVDPLMKKP